MRHGNLTVALTILPSNAWAQADIVDEIGRGWINTDPVIGGLCVILVLVVLWLARQWLKAIDALLAEKDSHRVTAESNVKAIGEFKSTIDAMLISSERNVQVLEQLAAGQRFGGKR